MRETPLLAALSGTEGGGTIKGGLAGWGGRDRTSEWRNQNPLPYRLATPQLALAGKAEDSETRRFQPEPVYRDGRTISTDMSANFVIAPASPPIL
jgi:hypothetical protein